MPKRWSDGKVFVVAVLLFAVLCRPIASANDGSRLATVESIVERGTFSIDGASIETIDKYRYDGRFYSDKPPLLALYAVVPYAIIHSLGIDFASKRSLAYAIVTVLTVGVLSAAGLVYLRRTLKSFTSDAGWVDLIVLLGATGTLLLPYSIVFSNHAPAAALLMFAFYHLVRAREGARHAALAGLFSALAGSIDILTFLFTGLFGLVILRRGIRQAAAFALPACAVFAVYLLLNHVISGSIVPPSMNQPLWDYPGSEFNESNLTGLAGQERSLGDTLLYAFHMLFGHRGLFSYTPVLVFSVLGAYFALSRATTPHRLELGAALLGCAVYVATYVMKSVGYGGYSYGIRWYADLMLLACVPLAFIGESVRRSPAFRRVFQLVAVASIFIAFVGVIKPFTPVSPETPNSFVNALSDPWQKVDHSRSAVIARNVRDGVVIALAVGMCVLFGRRLRTVAAASSAPG